MNLMDYYLILGLLVHVAFLGLVDWLGYHHLVEHGYHPSLIFLLILNVAIFFGLYYLVIRTLQRRLVRRRTARAMARQRAQPQNIDQPRKAAKPQRGDDRAQGQRLGG